MRHLLLPLAVLAALPATAGAGGLDGATRNFIVPTGELTAPGEVTWSQQDLWVAHTIGIGLTDGLELDLIIPPVPIGGQAQLRANLMPSASKVRLIAGGGVVLFPGIGAITTVSGTAAFHTEDLSLHATIIAYEGKSFEGQMGVLSAGATVLVSEHLALIADVTRFSVPGTECTAGPVSTHCGPALDTATVYSLGLKIVGKKLSGDIGIMLIDGLGYMPLPIITIHH